MEQLSPFFVLILILLFTILWPLPTCTLFNFDNSLLIWEDVIDFIYSCKIYASPWPCLVIVFLEVRVHGLKDVCIRITDKMITALAAVAVSKLAEAISVSFSTYDDDII